ncbi:MAG: DUF2778 domain-containing protein [Pseudolabrys sp.]|nr:DUF2778 domain-containing protein [Pseudolabrys sp.]
MTGGPYGTGPVASHAALKVALIDAAAPPVVPRDPRQAIKTPGPHLSHAYADPRIAAVVPLPRERPEVQIAAQAAAIPMPPVRQIPAAVEPEIVTGSLGDGKAETAQALAYAATPDLGPSPAKTQGKRTAALDGLVGGVIAPVVSTPNVIETTAPVHNLIGPVLPDKKLAPRKVAKPARPLTPYEKLYGAGPVQLASLTPSDAMANARADSDGIPHAPYDKQTAVYVITQRKVYLPDGTELEAHSGLGDKMDDPHFVHLRMRGATPPHVYDLKLRESLFHGVEAIRLTPLGGEDAIFGRDGLLAHSYMLGGKGQSNGCVSFRDYDTFLEAFKDGKINRLAVIAKLD